MAASPCPTRRYGLLALIAALAAVTAPAAAHARPFRVSSPHGTLTATVTDPTERPQLTVARSGRVELRADLGRVARNPRAARSRKRQARAARATARFSRLTGGYATTAGKRRLHVTNATLMTLRLPKGARLEIAAADDGIALRQTGFQNPTVSYRPLPGSVGYLQRLVSSYEDPYTPTPVSAASGKIAYPALLSAPDRTYALLSETGLADGTPGGRLTASRAHPGVLSTALAPREHEPRQTAWRTAVIGTLANTVESDLATDFAAPSRIADTSWIKPGRVTWSWWSEGNVPGAGGLGQQERYVDFAAAAGFEYSLVDAGWDASWVPALVRYGAAKGVRIVLWTDFKAIADPAVRARTLDEWASWGVAGVKADFFESDSADRLRAMNGIAADAAGRHLIVDFHGCTVPRGIQRTWPNVMTAEAVRGAEYLRNAGAEMPANNVTLAFTRNAIGSMDFTPASFSARARLSTASAQLAQSIVFESGLQHYADNPASYRSRPEALELLRQVPAAWDDVRYLSGAPGRWVTLARRSGQSWFAGSISALGARTDTLDLDFLNPARQYTARIYADGPGDTITATHRTVTSASLLRVPVAAYGGFSIAITPAT